MRKASKRAQSTALETVTTYSQHAQAARKAHGESAPPMPPAKLKIQAHRAIDCSMRLMKPGLMVLNDPVGTGKTLIALCAARLLLEGAYGPKSAVAKVLIVVPNKQVAQIWRDRIDLAGLGDRAAMAGQSAANRSPIVVATQADLGQYQIRLPRQRSNLLLIIDEAHRGLHNPKNLQYQNIQAIAQGARLLLVTATPFQLTPSGLERMLEIDGDTRRGDRIAGYGRAVAAWLTAQHALDSASAEVDEDTLRRRIESTKSNMRAALEKAEDDLRAVLMPDYPRKAMGMPQQFDLPSPGTLPKPRVEFNDQWARAYHVARLLPEVVAQCETDQGQTVARNNDAYMRMLDSSLGAWRASSVLRAARGSSNPKLQMFVDRLEDELGRQPGDHPKVRTTTNRAVDLATRTRMPRHVLIFCVWHKTQNDLETAINDELHQRGHRNVIVKAPNELHGAKSVVESFRRPPSHDNQPHILIIRDNLSESIDLDGGKPVVIHHDLFWSPVRWTQRMGRVTRASTGFHGPSRKDVVIPIINTACDLRLWDTLLGRATLTSKVIPNDLKTLVEQTLPESDPVD